MVGPNYCPPQFCLPSHWKSISHDSQSFACASPCSMASWKSFQDPVLSQLLREAITHNLDLKIATARILQARANRAYAFGQLFPELDLNATYSRGNPGYYTLNKRLDLFQGTLDASWELDFFGGNKRKFEAETDLMMANMDARNAILVSLLAEVVSNYIDVRLNQKRLEITQRSILSSHNNYKLTQSLQHAGIVSVLDVSQAESQYKTFSAQISLQTIALVAAKNRITALLGMYPGALDCLLDTKHPRIPQVNERILLSTPAVVLRERPDIRRAERELAAQTALIGSAVSDLFPKISIGALYGPQNTNLLPGIDIWQVAPRLHLPLLTFGRIRAQINFARAKEREAYYSYEETILNAFEDVENQLTGYVNMKQRERLLKQSVFSNQLALSLANERYKKGLSAFINVIQTEQALYETENASVIAAADKVKRVVALYKSLGIRRLGDSACCCVLAI